MSCFGWLSMQRGARCAGMCRRLPYGVMCSTPGCPPRVAPMSSIHSVSSVHSRLHYTLIQINDVSTISTFALISSLPGWSSAKSAQGRQDGTVDQHEGTYGGLWRRLMRRLCPRPSSKHRSSSFIPPNKKNHRSKHGKGGGGEDGKGGARKGGSGAALDVTPLGPVGVARAARSDPAGAGHSLRKSVGGSN